jgi:hypothetical protein
MTTLLCGAGHAGPRPFMTIRSPALHPIKRCVIKAFGLATNQHYFGAAGESLLRGKLDGSLSGFCTSLAKPPVQAIRSAGWLRRYWVLGKARVSAALRQELPGDSSHQTRRGQDGEAGLLAKRSLAFVEVPEVGRATDGNPGRLDEGASGAICCNVVTVCLEKFCPRCCGWKDTGRRSHKASEPRGSARCRRSR